MSRDIRSYFGGGAIGNKPSKPDASRRNKDGKRKASHNDITDDDIIPESPQLCQKDKKKKRARLLSSSDEESNDFVAKNKSIKSVKSPEKLQHASKKKSPTKVEIKNVTPLDFFGKGPVKRVSEMNGKKNETVKKMKTELGIHDDVNFEKTLIQIDDNNSSDVFVSKISKSPKQNNMKEPKVATKFDQRKSPRKFDKKKFTEIENQVGRPEFKTPTKVDNENKSPRKSDRKNSPMKNVQKLDSSDRKKAENSLKNDRNSEHRKSEDKDKHSRNVSCEISSKSHHDCLKSNSEERAKNGDKRRRQSSRSPLKNNRSNLSPITKNKFSMFIDDEVTSNESKSVVLNYSSGSPQKGVSDKNGNKTPTPKSASELRKKSLEDSVSELTDEERMERKRQSSILYKNYINRSGPKHHGSKEVPEGSPNCLRGYVFLVTGVLDSFEKEEIEEITKKFGGDFKKSVSKKVTHIVCGEDGGPAKLAQAEKLGIDVISEDDFLQLIRDGTENSPTQKSVDIKHETRLKREHSPAKTVANKNESSSKKIKKEPKTKTEETEVTSEYFNLDVKVKKEKPNLDVKVSEPVKADSGASVSSLTPSDVPDLPWVEKYRPQTLKQIIGQQGEKSCVSKLLKWLSEWYVNRKKNLPKPNPWGGDKHNGGYFKAALLSGPPGVGKTTSVGLVCKELGFDTVEFNASDTRSKTLLKEHLSDLVSTNSLAGFSIGKAGKGAVSKKHVIIMDEVDGMAGNEDRGGMQELLSLIKTSSVPIICMCNDKTSPKMRSLSSYCYDLTFTRPKVDQIKGAMLSVCFKEGIKIPPPALAQMITAANQDIRQVLNLLSVWSAANKNMSSEGVGKDSDKAYKDMKLGPWEVVRKVFSQEDHKNMSIHDKSDLFFHDYSLGPLFVQQNYLKVAPKCDKKEVLRRFAEASDCISLGDTVESKIRSNMAWSLLPLQAMYSSVMPGYLLEGHMAGQIDFPSWLGQNSRTNKMKRLAQELHSHTGLSTSGSKLAIRLDYTKHLRDAIIHPLMKHGADGIQESIRVLQDYHLLREDLDSLMELTQWPGQKDPYSIVESKVKAALTRTYNKEASALPYSQVSMKKSKSSVSTEDYTMDGDSENVAQDDDAEEDSDVEHDAMIKAKVSKASSTNSKNGAKTSKSSTSSKAGTSKGKSKK